WSTAVFHQQAPMTSCVLDHQAQPTLARNVSARPLAVAAIEPGDPLLGGDATCAPELLELSAHGWRNCWCIDGSDEFSVRGLSAARNSSSMRNACWMRTAPGK